MYLYYIFILYIYIMYLYYIFILYTFPLPFTTASVVSYTWNLFAGSSCIPEAVTKELRLYLVEKGSSDSSLEVNRLCEEIQLNIDV